MPVTNPPLTGEEPSAEGRGTAGGHVGQGTTMAGQQAVAEALSIRLAVTADDLGQRDHRLDAVGELLQGDIEARQHSGREMSINGGGLQALMTEQFLDDAKIDPVFQ